MVTADYQETTMLDLIVIQKELRQKSQEGIGAIFPPLTEGAPDPDGFCTKGCGMKIFRVLDESTGKALIPTCITCNTAYPLTPEDLYLPLLVINQRSKK